MKFRITQAEFDALSEDTKKLYTKQGDAFQLNVEGLPQPEDTTALKNAKEHEKKARQDAEAKVRELEEKLGKKAKDDGDIKALEESWQQKLTNRETELTKTIDGLRGQLQEILVENVAQEMASRISNSPKLLIPHLRSRLRVEEQDGKSVTRVLDANGKPSALNLADLEKEVVASEDFAPIIIASKASGGGARGSQRGGGAKPFKDMSETEKVDLYNRDPQAFDRLSKEE